MSTPSKVLLFNMPLFIVIFIDGMGLSLLFPILNSVLVNPASDFLPHSVSMPTRDFLYGLVVGIFMLCWFFGATILGDISDKMGRKKVLLVCLAGSFFGYLLSAVAIWMHSLLFLIVGRIIAGFTAGSQPIAQAAIVDISSNEERARNIGFILLAASLGFVFGPMIGGVLSESRLVSWFNFATPLYFAAAVSLLNAIFLCYFFHETRKTSKKKLRIRFHDAVIIFVSAFKNKRIRYLSLIFLMMIFGWSDYFTFISLFMLDRYHLSPFEISMIFVVMGIGFAIGCGVLVSYFTKRYALQPVVVVSSLLAALSALLTLILHRIEITWMLVFFIATTIALAYSVILAIFSNQVEETEQGWVMGVTGSIMALCFGLNALLTGFIMAHSIGLPIALSASALALSGVLMFFRKPRLEQEKPLS